MPRAEPGHTVAFCTKRMPTDRPTWAALEEGLGDIPPSALRHAGDTWCPLRGLGADTAQHLLHWCPAVGQAERGLLGGTPLCDTVVFPGAHGAVVAALLHQVGYLAGAASVGRASAPDGWAARALVQVSRGPLDPDAALSEPASGSDDAGATGRAV